MFSKYYECPPDYRKHPLMIVAEAIGKILGTIMAIALAVGVVLYLL